MTNGIPGIENISGDLDEITGKRCTFMAFPWRWPQGEGCASASSRCSIRSSVPHRDRQMSFASGVCAGAYPATDMLRAIGCQVEPG